jgi:hypothetical protein
VAQPTTLAARLATARRFADATDLELPLYVDPIGDGFVRAYLCHPERFFVLSGDGTLLLKGQPIEGGYSLDELERELAGGALP